MIPDQADKSEEIGAKTARIVDMLAANNLGGVLINLQHNFSWLTAGGANGVDLSAEGGSGALFVRNDGQRFVLANRIEMPRLLTEELTAEEFEPIEFPWQEEKASPVYLSDRAQQLLRPGEVIGSDVASPSVFPIGAALARCRYRLTSFESERFRALAGDAAQTISTLARTLSPGETEREIARRVDHTLAARKIRAVVNLVAADDRIRKYRHPVPTDRRWEKALMMVVCARRGGMIASLTRIVYCGQPPDDLRQRTRAAASVNAQLLSATRPGVAGSELYRIAASAYAAEGYPGEEQLHHQGGACGYRTRDWVAHPTSTESVELDQAFAWNPSVTGTKVEETCITSADGVEVLTTTPDWPQIPVTVSGREYLSPDVLCL